MKTEKSMIINVIRRSLRCIDTRLMDHGERVAYIALRIAAQGALPLDRQKLTVLSILHDIGAYKTEEISNMLHFETDDVVNHAVFGSVFLAHTTPLGPYTDVILYHHTPYSTLAPLDTPYKQMAALIFLADRIDILIASQTESEALDLQPLMRLSGTLFAPEYVELFRMAEADGSLSGAIRCGAYREVIDERLRSIAVSGEHLQEYLRMLVFAIDFRSPVTVTHTANTVEISKMLADCFELTEEQKRDIALGAFLHDVGKITIPTSILEHPGKLNDSDMALMRTHVTASAEIIDGLVTDQVARIATRHHEKLNGKGYPQGLHAEDLTLEERIVAVADVCSALTGRRSYKEPLDRASTLSILHRMADGGELCPHTVAMVCDNYDTFMHALSLADGTVIKLYETINRDYTKELQRMRETVTA